VAAEPVIGRDHRWSAAFARGARDVLAAAWRARLAAAAPGWVDLAAAVPIMDVSTAGRELGWRAERSAFDALDDLLAGFRSDLLPTPPLDASA
jgi:hypothetical protein